MAQMDGQMVRIAQMRSSEDEDSDSSEDGQGSAWMVQMAVQMMSLDAGLR